VRIRQLIPALMGLIGLAAAACAQSPLPQADLSRPQTQQLYRAGGWAASPIPSSGWQEQSCTRFRDATLRQIVPLSAGAAACAFATPS
jgi:hypothetical protein